MKTYISRKVARSFGILAYNLAKRGKLMFVTHHGVTHKLGHVIPHGFYLVAA